MLTSMPSAALTTAATCTFGALCAIYRLYTSLEEARRALDVEKRLRVEERRGRTRAEVSLRNLKKRVAVEEPTAATSATMKMTALGRIRTPFVKRAGTPRQGTVCPSSRGLLILEKNRDGVTPSTLDGLADYSHCWLLFEFHANTDDPTKKRSSKIAPPRGGGEKVGWLATRTPHRVNALGLSLVKIEGVRPGKLEIELSGVDLCDGTPVYDLKPYVPWDAPGSYVVPGWVSQDDVLRGVEWDDEALEGLERNSKLLKPFGYGADSVETAKKAISELLAQDPRNKRKRNQAHAERQGSISKEPELTYKIHFGGLEAEFLVHNLICRVVGVEPAPDDEDRLRLAS